MPTSKERIEILLTEEEVHRLDSLRVLLQSPALRRLSRRVSLNRWLAELALERAAEIEQELGAEE